MALLDLPSRRRETNSGQDRAPSLSLHGSSRTTEQQSCTEHLYMLYTTDLLACIDYVHSGSIRNFPHMSEADAEIDTMTPTPVRPTPIPTGSIAAFTMLALCLGGITCGLLADWFRPEANLTVTLVALLATVIFTASAIPPLVMVLPSVQPREWFRQWRLYLAHALKYSGFELPRIGTRYRALQAVVFVLAVPAAWIYTQVHVLAPLLAQLPGVLPTHTADPRSSWYAGMPVGLVIVAVGLGVLREELVFRSPGLVCWQLRDAVTGRSRTALTAVAVGGGWLLSTVAFGMIHSDYSWLNVIMAGLFGAVIYPLVLATRSIWPAVSAHLIWNLVAFGVLPML
ncbi:CPBP family intramembrane glutamic endopeptidase [Rhodococcus pyridinivorans]|uniref:CPBP family intramembrane glutamic endopeptidase n=1 Tax=Rhodococcus pyridinivorans TaxID=103816 RepID=UPI0022835406|nr:type II CAAX endopeptidase family protein [Rhodococcus pyridinivorans]WAL49694.1 type II CAAX endopeptidase family protein [Rhodococcus pyridinivorans]